MDIIFAARYRNPVAFSGRNVWDARSTAEGDLVGRDRDQWEGERAVLPMGRRFGGGRQWRRRQASKKGTKVRVNWLVRLVSVMPMSMARPGVVDVARAPPRLETTASAGGFNKGESWA